ncbi:MAG TPA: thiamine-monophosphate kinase [Planctomycetes bacterium]|nr:thiamine-monophosphate kinase [Planctomycetota bacterium]HIK62226.1 thiamine-monophosphate kinase [Planctomycetota bacterium]
MSWSEDSLHRWLAGRERPACLSGSMGHDAAVLRPWPGRFVVCTDQVVAGVHAELKVSAGLLGRKAAARALSDLAATAARPRALLLALRAPEDADEGYLRRLISAVDREGRRLGAPLVGGDLACSPGPLSLAVTAHGSLAGRQKAPGRDRIRPGHAILCTGPCGGSLLGRHLRIAPRILAGRVLHRNGATALMDVSDGLAWDLFRLGRSSRVAIDLQHVPIHPDAQRAARSSGRTALDHALHDGEDHELIASVPQSKLRAVLAAAKRADVPLVCMGLAREGAGLTLVLDGVRRPWLPEQGGWKHGA